MNTPIGSLVAFATGLALAFGGHLAMAPSPEQPTVMPVADEVRSAPTWVRADCPEEVEDGTLIENLTSELAEKQLMLKAAWAREEVYSGAPIDWPPSVDVRFTEEAVVAFLEASVAEPGGTLLGYDCGEYPCVATIGWQMYEDAHPGMDLIEEEYEGGPSSTGLTPHRNDDGYSYTLYRGFHPVEDLDDKTKKRMMFRTNELTTLNPVPEEW